MEYIHFSQPIPREGPLAWLGVGVSIFSIILLTTSMWVAKNQTGAQKTRYMSMYIATTGPYRHVRHPGYLSVILYVMGIALSLSSLIAWAALAMTIGFSIICIRKDEENLEKFYAEKFIGYKVQTPWILLPGLL